MNTTIQTTPAATTAFLEGRLDTAAAPQFEAAIQPLMNLHNSSVCLDCSRLEYISSSGLRLFISLLKACKRNASTLTLQHLNDSVMEVFRMTDFVHIFRIE